MDAPAGQRIGVNPARAGMIPLSMRAQGLADRKPRASGDDPALLAAVQVRAA